MYIEKYIGFPIKKKIEQKVLYSMGELHWLTEQVAMLYLREYRGYESSRSDWCNSFKWRHSFSKLKFTTENHLIFMAINLDTFFKKNHISRTWWFLGRRPLSLGWNSFYEIGILRGHFLLDLCPWFDVKLVVERNKNPLNRWVLVISLY